MNSKKKPKILRKPLLPPWLDFRALIVMGLLGVLMMAMALSEPLPQHSTANRLAAQMAVITQTPQAPVLAASPSAQATPPGTILNAVPTATPIPPEWFTNREMADGLVLGAVALVLIIVGGTLSVIRRRP